MLASFKRFSAVSKQIFGSKQSLLSIFPDLSDLYTSAAFQAKEEGEADDAKIIVLSQILKKAANIPEEIEENVLEHLFEK